MEVTANGVLHGDRIDLDRPVRDIPDGAEVSITIKRKELSLEEKRKIASELFGAWADDPSIPGIFEEIQRDRERPSTRPEVNFDDPS